MTPVVYISSRYYHAPVWQQWRDAGVPLRSSWIDSLGDESPAGLRQQWEQNVEDIRQATGIVLYCQPGEVLKGALVEVGIALSFSKTIACVGLCDATDAGPQNATYAYHALWRTFPCLLSAFSFYGIVIPDGLPQPVRKPALPSAPTPAMSVASR